VVCFVPNRTNSVCIKHYLCAHAFGSVYNPKIICERLVGGDILYKTSATADKKARLMHIIYYPRKVKAVYRINSVDIFC